MKILNALFMTILISILIVVVVVILLDVFEEESDFGGLKEITGTPQAFEVFTEGQYIPKITTLRPSERYDDKYLSYLDHKQKRRDKTFLR